MELDIIENSGPDNLRDALKFQLARASEVCIAVAFITQSGLDEIVQSLREVATRGRVRLLTGLYQKVTEPQALWALLRVQEQTRDRISTRLSREPQFHRKVYLLRTPRESIAIIGSSNLTRDGLRSGGELNLIVRLPKTSLPIRKMMQAFDDDWERRAVPLNPGMIAQYEKTRAGTVIRENYTKGQLASILGAAPSHIQATQDSKDRRFWRDCVTGTVRNRTKQIISETTNWDDKNYWWYSAGASHPYRICDQIFLFDFEDKCVRLVEVKDIARTKVRTPDGRHFVAYRPLLRLARRFSKRFWSAMKGESIDRKNAQSRRKIHRERAEQLKALIRSPKRRKRQ